MSSDNQSEQAQNKLAQIWASLEWVWVLAIPISEEKDSLLIMEDQGSAFRFIPVFENKEDAEKMLPKLCEKNSESQYEAQAISLEEAASFAAKKNLTLMVLDGVGKILAQINVEIKTDSLEIVH